VGCSGLFYDETLACFRRKPERATAAARFQAGRFFCCQLSDQLKQMIDSAHAPGIRANVFVRLGTLRRNNFRPREAA
jgi:hypothetical protein